MGIYSEIFKKAGALIKKGSGQKTPKTKKMKKINLSPEQKARLKGAGKKAFDFVQSGKLATITGQATRYSQGKPVVIKRTMSKEEKQTTPDTVNVFGYQVPKTTAYVGGGIAVLGLGYLATRLRR
jgi:hypothetical protein